MTDFETRYANVPDAQKLALQAFRRAHPPQTVTVAAKEWSYLTAGQRDNPALLWLVGGLKRADAAYRSIPLLADDFYIIAPDYPAIGDMDALADGLSALLDHAGVDRAHVLAGSFGGMLAQVMLRRHPARLNDVILSTTTAPDPDQIAQYQQLREMVAVAPDDLVREQAAQQFMGIIAPPDAEKAFYQAYLGELFDERLNKDDILSTYDALIDFCSREFSAGAIADWSGAMLIITSDDDATFGAGQQAALTALYPQAEVHTFSGAGHSPGSTQREAYFQRVCDFLIR